MSAERLADDALAARLGVSVEAVACTRANEVVDLHLDTFIPYRLFGYDWSTRHDQGGPLGRYLFGHVDWPRAADGGLTGAIWSITTNVFRPATSRWRVFLDNLARMEALLARSGARLTRTHGEYLKARSEGRHAAMIGIQGGNALDAAPEGPGSIPGDAVVRITLVHLTNASLGATSAPFHHWRADKGLSPTGRDLVRRCNDRRIFVDLAHVHERGFWDAVQVHDRDQPLLVTHTGVSGVTPHWRNLTDDQIRAVADTGGVVGIIFEPSFLTRPGGPRDAGMVVDHLEHLIAVGGEQVAALGSDFDGAIRPTADLRGADHYPVLVQHLLARRWAPERITRVLGANFLASFARLRP